MKRMGKGNNGYCLLRSDIHFLSSSLSHGDDQFPSNLRPIDRVLLLIILNDSSFLSFYSHNSFPLSSTQVGNLCFFLIESTKKFSTFCSFLSLFRTREKGSSSNVQIATQRVREEEEEGMEDSLTLQSRDSHCDDHFPSSDRMTRKNRKRSMRSFPH